ncbi:nicotinamidase/pyrazinamidase [Angulomicrobium tetraedrale]|uniref:nicotinamidase n=1 Tax=Ancylobacter tetraedralis TaxID=217068 RepID=A0A839ZD61_9HYPH|nr:bifunctional nicotinamidase/pyrazinamidase [Ancylobacter tetraedralis]MBB3772606.1 nicotinamidase/pyrazinamidase [Ancylobacter tetraedralis]
MAAFQPRPADALVVVDPQNDFCPGGALAVAGGDEILPGINRLSAQFPLVVVTQDWHPADHTSFASNHAGAAPFSTLAMPYGPQILWPDHCVQGTAGAEFHPVLHDGALRRAHLILRKGWHRSVDSYSAFFENDHRTPTGLAGYLRDKGVRRCVFVGLAYDFCAAWSALDAVKLGFDAVIIKELSRAIALPLGEGGTTEDAAERDFHAAGVQVVISL